MPETNKEIDETGFWEIIFLELLYGQELYIQTSNNYLVLAKIIINKKTKSYKIKRYWDFNIELNSSLENEKNTVNGLYDILTNLFSKLKSEDTYHLGLSGGLDSRITLAFLKNHIPSYNIKCFTYGYNKNILEYKYAYKLLNM